QNHSRTSPAPGSPRWRPHTRREAIDGGEPLLLVHICCDKPRIDREPFAASKPSRDARRHHALEHPAQDIALTKALMQRTAEHRMIGNPVLDTELAKPSVGQIDLHLSANPSLRADRIHVAAAP